MGDGCQHQPMCACANEVERLRSALEAAEREREEFRDLYNAAWNRASLAEATVERLTRELAELTATGNERLAAKDRALAAARAEALEANAAVRRIATDLEQARAEAGALREALVELARGYAERRPHHMNDEITACLPNCEGCKWDARWNAALAVARALAAGGKP